MPFSFIRGRAGHRLSSGATPPGPHSLNPMRSALAFRRNPLDFLTTLTQKYGDITQFSLLTQPTYFLNHPTYLKHILQEKHPYYDRDVIFTRIVKIFTGDGLSTNLDEESWLRQRRLIQPIFSRRSIVALGSIMVTEILAMLERWEEAAAQRRQVDIGNEMSELTLRIASKAFFNRDFREMSHFLQAFREVNHFLGDYFRFPFPPLSVPTTRHRRFRASIRVLDNVVFDIIQQHRQRNEKGNDLLSLLLTVVDEKTGEGMNNQQLRDEVITFLGAGAETTMSALCWMWYLLSQHPEVEQRLHSEIDTILAGELPSVEDLSRFPYARMIIDEALRLYPSIWIHMRKAVQDDTIGNYHVPAKTWILFSPYTIHRHPDFWENPDHFEPEHCAPEQLATLPRFAFIPFGGGPHMCIGQGFAYQEMLLILLLVAQRYRLVLAPQQTIEPLPMISLQMSEKLLMKLEQR